MSIKYVIVQDRSKGPNYPEMPAYVRVSSYSPMYGWRVTDTWQKVFSKRAEAEEWCQQNPLGLTWSGGRGGPVGVDAK